MPDECGGKHLKIWTPATYHIEVEGDVGKSLSGKFGNMRIANRKRKDGSILTILVGRVRDQAELSGLLNSLYDFHLPILSVKCVSENNEYRPDNRSG